MLSTSNNTYLIDIHKKCLLSAIGGGNSPSSNAVDAADIPESLIGVPYTAYGNLSDDFLKQIGMGFTEGFEHAAEEAKKSFDLITKPVAMVLNGILSGIPILKGVNAKDGGLRDATLRAVALLGGFMGMPGFRETAEDGSKLSKEASVTVALQEAFDRVYLYDPPIRKAPPQMTVEGSKQLTIDFQYGACNVYDAYWEVYYPLMQIKNSFFPKVKAEGIQHGTITWKSNSIPYQQQVFVEVLKKMLSPITINTEDSRKDFNPDYSNTLKTLATSSKKFEKLVGDSRTKLDKQLAKVTDKKLNDNHTVNGGWAVNSWNENTKNIYEKIKAADTGGNPETDITLEARLTDSKEDKDEAASDNTTVRDYTTLKANELYDAVESEAGGDSSKVEVEGKLPTQPQKPGTASDLRIYVAKEDSADKENLARDIVEVLGTVVNWEPYVIGETLQHIYNEFCKKQCINIYMSFPNIYKTSLAEYFSKNGQPKDGIHKDSFVSLNNILIKSAKIQMDYSNVDERGFPMSGKFIISDMWPLLWPAETLDFTKSQSNDFVKNNIKYS